MTASERALAGAGAARADSGYAWLRLAVSAALGTIGGVGFWSIVVALPAIERDFGIGRAEVSLAYTTAMLGFALGGIAMGRLADRFGITVPLVGGALALGLGYIAAGSAASLTQLVLAEGLLIGLGSAATLGPLLADVSLWFTARRGLAVSIAAAGNYLAGVIWPAVLQPLIAAIGWRQTHIGLGLFCLATMLPLAFLLRRRAPRERGGGPAARPAASAATALGLGTGQLQVLLALAGVMCCVAMSMPQVHLVAYCGDLGYGPARGAQMLSLMLGLGLVSRIGSGFVADRIGGLATLLLGSVLQALALFLYTLFQGLPSLYVISGLFGLFQGGITPSYAIIVREYFAPHEAGTRLGIVLTATMLGMALGGWMSGEIFDLTGSYRAAFLNGLLWNLGHAALVLSLLLRGRWRPVAA